MPYTIVNPSSGDVLGASDIVNLQANFPALATQESGAPELNVGSLSGNLNISSLDGVSSFDLALTNYTDLDISSLNNVTKGTYTNSVVGGFSSGPSILTNCGDFVRNGDQVTITSTLIFNGGTADTGTFYLGGLPFPAKYNTVVPVIFWNATALDSLPVIGRIGVGADSIIFRYQTTTSFVAMQGEDVGTAGNIEFSVTYII